MMKSIRQKLGLNEDLPGKAPLRVLGMDLGTTNSTVTEISINPVRPQDPDITCIPVTQKTIDTTHTHAYVPSMVALVQGKQYVGEGAKRLRTNTIKYELTAKKNLFYGCKNDMGNKKTYQHAPEGYRSAPEIAGHVLKYLNNTALTYSSRAPSRTVVTVPASFQASQRNDTLQAAQLAGIPLGRGDLLDEPVAAFIDYMLTYGLKDFALDKTPRNLMVFDFGGGTCDVALFRIFQDSEAGIAITPLSVSRYHRLGGGDIDSAIVHNVLIPEFCAQNSLNLNNLAYEDKKHSLEPALLNAAESLKVNLCEGMSELFKNKRYWKTDKNRMVSTIKDRFICRLWGRDYVLKNPALHAGQFEEIMEPFLDWDLLYARDTEYTLTSSIFSPITDCLDRQGMSKTAVDGCLLAGGSSLIPQVAEAVKDFFPHAAILRYPDSESIQTTVSRGAAWHALALALTGKSIITPVCHDGIAIKTKQGPVEIIPRGISLPNPAGNEYNTYDGLCVPESTTGNVLKVRVELVSSSDDRPLFNGLWEISENVVNQGDPIRLEYRFDENRSLWLRLLVDDGVKRTPYNARIENPLTQIINPNRTRLKILEIEENIRTRVYGKAEIMDRMVELADLYTEIGQREKAIYVLKKALKWNNRPDTSILTKLGILYGEIGNRAQQERMYREAGKAADAWGGPMFNLALAQEKQGNVKEALASVNNALEKEDSAPYKVLKGRLLQKQGRKKEGEDIIKDAMQEFQSIKLQDEWELGWYSYAAEVLDEKERAEKADKAIKDKKREKEDKEKNINRKTGVLPIMRGLAA